MSQEARNTAPSDWSQAQGAIVIIASLAVGLTVVFPWATNGLVSTNLVSMSLAFTAVLILVGFLGVITGFTAINGEGELNWYFRSGLGAAGLGVVLFASEPVVSALYVSPGFGVFICLFGSLVLVIV